MSAFDALHLEVVKRGARAVAEWRSSNPDSRLALSGADLSGVDLSEADLSNAILTQTNLNGADLHRAKLGRALLIGAELSTADLTEADLQAADLSTANLSMASLGSANFNGARLCTANLIRSDLQGANFTCADLSGATLMEARCTDATFIETNFWGADLLYTNIINSILVGADISHARLGFTVLADLDLSEVRGLTTASHAYGSEISVSTLYRSHGKIPEEFLRGCGVPENLINYLHSLTGKALDFHSCFIAYTEADDALSGRLYQDLQAAGVRCWRWREDAKWGRILIGEVDSAIRLYDKLVVILSADSLRAEPVVREIERALQKEAREHKEVLFPIRVDGSIFTWEHPLQADVVRKVIGDFRQWQEPSNYEAALRRLTQCLDASPGNPA